MVEGTDAPIGPPTSVPEKRRPGRPKGSGYLMQEKYNKLRALAQLQANQKELAIELGISESEFSKRLKKDPKFKDAYETGLHHGRIRVRQEIYESIFNVYFTICTNPDCGQVTEDADNYLPACPSCGGLGTDPQGRPKHYPVKRFLQRGDGENQRLFAKNYLGMSDKVTVEGGDEDKPVVFATLADFVKAQAAKQHGSKKQKER